MDYRVCPFRLAVATVLVCVFTNCPQRPDSEYANLFAPSKTGNQAEKRDPEDDKSPCDFRLTIDNSEYIVRFPFVSAANPFMNVVVHEGIGDNFFVYRKPIKPGIWASGKLLFDDIEVEGAPRARLTFQEQLISPFVNINGIYGFTTQAGHPGWAMQFPPEQSIGAVILLMTEFKKVAFRVWVEDLNQPLAGGVILSTRQGEFNGISFINQAYFEGAEKNGIGLVFRYPPDPDDLQSLFFLPKAITPQSWTRVALELLRCGG